ncbi:helix-turn-helix domain-containing protein [Gilliamella bombi]|uniref:helix-turn-helix domain-containing protein n=1 Tax=Gilliamella bombi TaxID=1908521 RepID=UPI000A1682A3|nr:helix-turn-helix transcriptional regulator [Gilliamella bombi]
MSDLLIIGGVVIVPPVERTGELGKFIAKTRIDLGFTQAQLAEKMGVSNTMISMIEKRQKPISAELIDAFFNAVNLDAGERTNFIQLAVTNNVAIYAEKTIKKLVCRG